MTFELVRPTTWMMSQLTRRDLGGMSWEEALTLPAAERPTARRPSRVRREMYRGDTFQAPVVIVDARTQQPIDVTGWTVWFTSKFAYQNPDLQAAFRADNIPGGAGGVTFVDAGLGQVLVVAPPLATYGYGDGPTDLLYDVQVEDAGGVITTVEVGTLTVHPDVTRAIGG